MNGLSLWPDLLCEALRRVSVKDKRQSAQLVDKAWNRVLKQAAAPGTWGPVRIELAGLLGSLEPDGLYTADVSAVVSGSVAWLSFRCAAIDKIVLAVTPAHGHRAAFYLQCYLPRLLGALAASGKTPRLEILLSALNLHLSENQFTEFPDALAGLSALETLFMRTNQIAELPASISGLSSLQHLDLIENCFAVFPDAALAGLSSMVHLTLEKQQDNGESLAINAPIQAFSNMPDLAIIGLRQNFGDREAGLDDISRFHVSNTEMRLRLEQTRGERKTVPHLDYE
ncbi:hypothetical protein WJX72_010767 [[Myrmecia] bisecta]|uniref:Leucine-rich repeat domain-containing protein n=1 Tax=[Myrmecia] bisecta TaxID=41462 RepID=A0AAW1QSL7_9CHLO